MTPNPILKKLGLSDHDRAVIFHADDIGMCEGSVSAYRDLMDFGLLSSAATMVPCPWFPAAAALFRSLTDNPRLDVGIHLTFNSEWDVFRWGPLSTRDPQSGLMDADGYFFNRTDLTHEKATDEAVRLEMVAQIERGLQAGFPVSHIDTHMLCLFQPRFLPIYLDVARQYQLPAFAFRASSVQWRTWTEGVESSLPLLEEAEAEGQPLMDYLDVMSLDAHENRLEEAKAKLANLPAGLSYFLIHPVKDTPELRAMAPDWRSRVGDYELFTSEAWRKVVQDSGVQVLGWKDLRF